MSVVLQEALPLAHAGHVVVDLAVYLGPVLGVAAWLTLSAWRERRGAREETKARPRLGPDGRREPASRRRE